MSVVQTEVIGNVGYIHLDRPERMNAITVELGRELELALRELGGREDVNVVVVRGRGGNFCVGGDFQEVERLREGGPQALAPLFDNFSAACTAVGDIDAPVVAVVEGCAMAGGFEFMLAADVVLVRDEAKIADNHSNFGQLPGGGSSQRLPRLVGRQRAMGHILTGDRLSGRDAADWGVAYRSYPADEFEAGVDAVVAGLAAKRRDALVGIKRLVRRGLTTTLEDGLALERSAVIAHIAGDAGGAGVSNFNSRSTPTRGNR